MKGDTLTLEMMEEAYKEAEENPSEFGFKQVWGILLYPKFPFIKFGYWTWWEW